MSPPRKGSFSIAVTGPSGKLSMAARTDIGIEPKSRHVIAMAMASPRASKTAQE